MKWKTDARKPLDTKDKLRESMDGAVSALAPKPIIMLHGKPFVVRTHTRDFVETDDAGVKSVTASSVFRQGSYIFPKAYLHPKKRIVGETKDVRLTDRGWLVYIDALLRGPDGYPVKFEGSDIDMSGWYLETDLRDANLGMEVIRPGATAPSIASLEASRSARILRLTKLRGSA